MNEQNRKQVMILGGLGLFLVAYLVWTFVLNAPATTPGSKTAGGATKEVAAMQDIEIDPAEMMKIVTFKPQKYMRGRNPLEPTALTPVEGLDNVVVDTAEVRDKIKNVREKVVTAIIYDNVRPMAIIDDEVVELGYVYPDGIVKIHAIEPDKVIFEVEQMLVPVDMKEL